MMYFDKNLHIIVPESDINTYKRILVKFLDEANKVGFHKGFLSDEEREFLNDHVLELAQLSYEDAT